METAETIELKQSTLAQHHASIMQQMRSFWIENHLCDVVLKDNNGTEHGAHTVLLSAASVYFKKLLGGSFLEANQVQRKQPVEIGASKAAVSALLDHIYGGQPKVNLETALELLRLAEAYDLPKLASATEFGLRISLNSHKALRILQETHGFHSLKAACEAKVADDFEACAQHPDFGKLGATQLVRVLLREDLSVSREEVVFKSIFNWFSFSKDRDGFLGILLQHVDFRSFSVDNLLRIARLALSGPSAEELHRKVDEALQFRKGKRAASTQRSKSFRPKRQCLKHWSPDLGASAKGSWQEVVPIPCRSLSWHNGSIYATDFAGHVLCWKPGDPVTSARKVAGRGTSATGINALGKFCDVSVSPTGEIFVLDQGSSRIVRFQEKCGHLACSVTNASGIFCSPNGVVHVVVETEGKEEVQKLIGSKLQTVIASKNLSKDLQFMAAAIFVAKDDMIYISVAQKQQFRVLRINPSEPLGPAVVGQIPNPDENDVKPWGLFVTEGGTIYVADHDSGKVLAFRPGDTTPTEVLQCPDPLRPMALLIHDRSLYVSVVDNSQAPTAGGIYEHLLPPELQLG